MKTVKCMFEVVFRFRDSCTSFNLFLSAVDFDVDVLSYIYKRHKTFPSDLVRNQGYQYRW